MGSVGRRGTSRAFFLAARGLLAAILCLHPWGTAGATEADNAPWARAEWSKLGQWDTGGVSDIRKEDFFLSPVGRTNRQAEYEATLAAFRGEDSQAAVCRFPARAIYMERTTDLRLADPFATCGDFAGFVGGTEPKKVSMLFVSGYLDNPGSAFGHTLLRIEYLSGEGQTYRLDRSINYGAAESEQDSPIAYVVRGLTGRYASRFTTLDFYHHAERYKEQQLRNIWQYELALDPAETDYFLAHLWELLNAEHNYYFLQQNCAYRLAQALELVVDRDLTPTDKFWATPMDIINRIANDPEGKTVRSVRRLSSRQTRYLDGYDRLGGNDRALFRAVLEEDTVPIADLMERHGRADRTATLDVLVDYFALSDGEAGEARQREALGLRLALPGAVPPGEPPAPAPHTGQYPTYLQLSALANAELGGGAELRIRPAYFDFLTDAYGRTPYSELSILEAVLVARDEDLALRSFDVVRVSNLPTDRTTDSGIPRAWRVRFGVEDRDLACDGCNLLFGEAGIGIAREPIDGAAVYALASGRLEIGGEASSTANVRFVAGLVSKLGPLPVAIEGGVQQGLDRTEGSTEPFGKIEARLLASPRWDLRAGLAYEAAAEGRFSLGYYW